MGMVVQHNMNAINAYNKLNTNVAGLKKSSEKLSSGYRINRAGDDAAGLAISEKMRSQIRGLTQAKRNAQDGISMIQTYEGAAQETHNILQRMKELATESANGTYQNEVDRDAIQLEFDQLNDELDQIADTDFNGTVMLNGGQMADGTKATNGKFDYVNAVRSAQQVGSAGGYVLGVDTGTYTGTTEETVTFTVTDNGDGTYTWEADDQAAGTLTNKDNGGFEYNGAVIAVDTSKLVSGDTVVVNFTKPSEAVKKTAVTTGYNVDGDDTGVTKVTGTPITIEAENADITTAGIADALNSLDGISVGYSATKDSKSLSLKTINGIDVSTATNDKKVTLSTLSKTESLKVGAEGAIYYSKTGSTDKLIATAAKELTASENAANTGTVTVESNVADAVYKPATETGVELVEPEGEVSQSNSNDAATAPLTYTDHLVLQTGARTKDSVDFTFNYSSDGMGDLKANMNISSREDGLGTANLSLLTQEDANAAIDKIDNAINKNSMVRATFGATQNRLDHKIENLTTTTENITEAESNIRDTDMASEMLNYTKYNILQQAAQSMLAQANQQPQSILQLLG